MTEDDKRKQKEKLILEFCGSVENMKALRHKIRTTENELAVVVEWAREARTAIDRFDPSGQFWSKILSDHVNILESPQYREAMDYKKMVELLAQFSGALRRVEELRASKLELGIGA
jgi:hypothetical protein